MTAYFVTGTDTGIGKTLVSCALLYAYRAQGRKVIGMKPVAAGAENGEWMDVELLAAASNVTAARAQRNPYAFGPAVAPHIAAVRADVELDIRIIDRSCRRLRQKADVVIVEGAGGFLVPLTESQDTADMAQMLGLPVILVVGMRLGCINHALLTARAIRAAALPLAGWVANCIDPAMRAFEENVASLMQRLGAPLVGVLPHVAGADARKMAPLLDIAKLETGGA